MPETSVIIISHNGLRQNTAPCLESIFGNEGDFEVIVVDNDSSDETSSYLSTMMAGEPRLKCIFNKSNRGFAGGNNDGLRIASGEFLVLLNSDCIVTEGWLEGLIAPLSRDRGIGLVGPVSNSVGNEQKIFTRGQTPDRIIEEGVTWVSNSRGSRFETDMLSFFCVAMRRDVFAGVGMLDESFGLGFYEDDDYCMRVRIAGYRLVCVEDVFIYHRGGGSFDRLPQGTRKIMRENRGKLRAKYPSGLKVSHPRQKQLKVVEGYLNAPDEVPDRGKSPEGHSGVNASAGVRFRISNRMMMIESIMPRGIFKKWAFNRRLDRLKKLLAAKNIIVS